MARWVKLDDVTFLTQARAIMDGVDDDEEKKVITKKIQKIGPHSVASEITEELRKQKSYKKWRLFQ